jgi:DNA repair photolyase
VKTNLAEVLDRELTKKTWKGNLINISGVCDCYQPLENEYKLMPDILKVLIKHRNPVFILTKSPLILRDYDLIRELSSKTRVCIATTVTTLDENIRQKIEPNTFPSRDRIEMLHEFSRLKKCQTNIMLMPIIPHLTDSRSGIEAIYHISRTHGIGGVIAAILHLRGELKNHFYRFLEVEFPNILLKIRRLYRGGYADREYSRVLYRFIGSMKNKYRLFENRTDLKESICDDQIQLNLFDQ